MNRKKIIGVALILLSLVLVFLVWSEIEKTVTLSGLWSGSTASYDPPFPGHNWLIILAGIAAVVLFLVGLYLISPNRKR